MTTLHPCTCGAEAKKLISDKFFVKCIRDCCWFGPARPTEAEAAEAWNSLMRGRAPDAPKEGTVRVRLPAHWTMAFGGVAEVHATIFPDGTVKDFNDAKPPFAVITADLPLPKPVEVAGRVEP